MLFMSPHDYRKTIFILGTILNPCFDVGLSSGRLQLRLSRPLDEGTKINIVDDENKILDTGPTGRGLNLVTPAKRHFPKARGFRASRASGYIRTHTRPAMSGELNGGICIFYKPGVICIPGRASPMLRSMYQGARSPPPLAHVRQTDTRSSIYRWRVSPSERRRIKRPAWSTCSQLTHLLPRRRTDTLMSIGMNLTNNQQ